MASMISWKRILRQLKIGNDGIVYPVSEDEVLKYEKRHKCRLPSSYRTYSKVFGPGRIGDIFSIAVPGYRGSVNSYSLDSLTDMVVNGLSYRKYASEHVEQLERAIYICLDESRSFYFLDRNDVTRTRPIEFAVYELSFKYAVNRLANSFWEFVIKYCLGDKYSKLFPNSTPELSFNPTTT